VRSLAGLREELSADIFISYCRADVPKNGQDMIDPKRIRDCLEDGGYRWLVFCVDIMDKINVQN
jgi:hypothetical protein